MRAVRPLVVAGAALVALVDAYLLALLVAARRHRAAPAPPARSGQPFVVLVPAHDEETTLPRLLASLGRAEGRDHARVVVVADNCTDRTAEVAAAHGAEVLERHDTSKRGKGAAMAWALEQLEPLQAPVVLVDADCEVSPNLLTALGVRAAAGIAAAQVDYVVANPTESPTAGLRAAAFLLVNSIRPAGRNALGLSAGLLGTGMMFTPELLRRVPWRDFGLAEDLEYGLRLAAAGERVVFVPEARVTSPMPVSGAAGTSQQLRWEAGKIAAARVWSPRLVALGVRRRDPRALVAGLEVLVPPQALLLLMHAVLAAAALVARAPAGVVISAGGLVAQAVYVLGGLALVRAPRAVWAALLRAPALVIGKAAVAIRIATGGSPDRWVRTARGGGQGGPDDGR